MPPSHKKDEMPEDRRPEEELPMELRRELDRKRDSERIYLEKKRLELAYHEGEVTRLKRIISAHGDSVYDSNKARIGESVILPLLERRGTWVAESEILEECARERGSPAQIVRLSLSKLVKAPRIEARGPKKNREYRLMGVDVKRPIHQP